MESFSDWWETHWVISQLVHCILTKRYKGMTVQYYAKVLLLVVCVAVGLRYLCNGFILCCSCCWKIIYHFLLQTSCVWSFVFTCHVSQVCVVDMPIFAWCACWLLQGRKPWFLGFSLHIELLEMNLHWEVMNISIFPFFTATVLARFMGIRKGDIQAESCGWCQPITFDIL